MLFFAEHNGVAQVLEHSTCDLADLPHEQDCSVELRMCQGWDTTHLLNSDELLADTSIWRQNQLS